MEKSTALLIIDVQEAMFSYDLQLYDEEGVMDRIVSLQQKARSAGTPIVYIQHTEDEEYTKVHPLGRSVTASHRRKAKLSLRSLLGMLFTERNCKMNSKISGSRIW